MPLGDKSAPVKDAANMRAARGAARDCGWARENVLNAAEWTSPDKPMLKVAGEVFERFPSSVVRSTFRLTRTGLTMMRDQGETAPKHLGDACIHLTPDGVSSISGTVFKLGVGRTV